MTLAIDKVDRRGLSNTVHHEHLTEDKVDTVLAIETDVLST